MSLKHEMGVYMVKKLVIGFIACFFFFAPAFHIFGAMNDITPTTQVNAPVSVKSDEDIAKAVKDAFSADKGLAAFAPNVDVKVDKGVVTLSGTVNNDKAKADFAAKAKTIAGVSQVVNNIIVKSE